MSGKTLQQWLDEWESAVIDNQSTISRDEAIRRFRALDEEEEEEENE